MVSKELIREALASGLEPITMMRQTVFSTGSSHDPMAYRTRMVINSTLLGTLTPDEFQIAADKSARGILLSDRALYFVCQAIEEMLSDKERDRFQWISFYCPVSMLTRTDIISTLEKTFGGDKEKRSRLCLEFPGKILYEEPEKLREAILEMKLLGVKTALTDYGSEFCPMMRLSSFPFDYVILDPSVREMLLSKTTSKAAETLISYARNLHIEVIGTGLQDEEELSIFYKSDCCGYTDNGPLERLLPEIKFEFDLERLNKAEKTDEVKDAGEQKPDIGTGREQTSNEKEMVNPNGKNV